MLWYLVICALIPLQIIEIEIKDRLSGNWLLVADQACTTSDQRTVIPLKNDIAQFVDPITLEVDVRVSYVGNPAILNWYGYFNWVEWEWI